MSESTVSVRKGTSVGRSIAAAGFAPGLAALVADKPRIYLAGPMTGLPEQNYPAFDAETERLRGLGYMVENPAETPTQESWEEYMRHAIAKMMRCDELALLPGWSRSRGAFMEYSIAKRVGMPCRRAGEITEPASESAFA